VTGRHSDASVQMPGGSGPLALPEMCGGTSQSAAGDLGVLGLETDTIARAQGLLDRFLARRQRRTLAAYTLDIEEFAGFAGQPPPLAIAQLLAAGPIAGRDRLLDYAVHLRELGRAQATVNRRLGTLRALLRMAVDLDLIDSTIRMPSENQIRAATEEPPTECPHYLFPAGHPGESYRLDVQHYALWQTLKANFLAPIDEPSLVLDVGCGTGRWGLEVCGQFPGALVVGLDLVAGESEQRLSRYRFVKGDVLKGLPFADGRFDFVHQRFLLVGVPLASWPAVVRDLVRVTQAGGWVELTEIPWMIEGAGPATERLLALGREMAASRGLDPGIVVFDSLDGYLRQAGLENVVRREFSIPIGEWGGRVGSLMATDGRAALTRLCEARQARSLLSAEEARELIREAVSEWERSRLSAPCAVVFGRKSTPPASCSLASYR
jgi:SAM-dependent methyltransferase